MSNSSNNTDWGRDIESILENIRVNSVILSNAHKQRYFYLKSWLKYFKIPSIIFSAINSVIAIGLSNYMKQDLVSVINCLISLIIGVLNSIELYIGVEKEMSIELVVSKDYYLLSVNIFKILNLDRANRNIDGGAFLDSCLSTYSKLFENSCVLQKKVLDKLTVIDEKQLSTTSSDELNVEIHQDNMFTF
jgi:hypothetical protein